MPRRSNPAKAGQVTTPHKSTSTTTVTRTSQATVSDEDLNEAVEQTNKSPSYAVNHLSYPEDLLNVPDYGGNYVMFFINERQESKIVQNVTCLLYTSPSPRDRG